MAVVVQTSADQKLVALQARLDATELALEEALKVKKSKILDSGANICIISDITHLDSNTLPLCRRAEDHGGVETASGVAMPISGNGTICGVEGKICEGASFTLILLLLLLLCSSQIWQRSHLLNYSS